MPSTQRLSSSSSIDTSAISASTAGSVCLEDGRTRASSFDPAVLTPVCLVGRVLRTFYSLPPPDGEGVPCSPGDVVVWEGLEHIRKISQVAPTLRTRQAAKEADLPARPN